MDDQKNGAHAADPGSDAVKLEGVSYIYAQSEETAVDGVDMVIPKGGFVAVLGRNGSGKSTVAKLINALYAPSKGKVLVLSMDTADEDKTFVIREKAGMVFQNPDNQMVATIVEEDVAFGPENLGVAPEEIRKRVDDSLLRVGMQAFASSAPHMLSGGQKQRVGIAGVLAMRPEIIIFDEATAMLDPYGREEVMNTVLELHRQGITVIWITHFMEEAALADQIIVMEGGHVKVQGTPREVFTQKGYDLRRWGLDLPPATALARTLLEAGYPVDQNALTLDEVVDGICRLL